MIGFRTKLLLFVTLIILVVIVTWVYAQRTYSAFNVTSPGDEESPNGQSTQGGPAVPDLNQTPIPTATLMPTETVTIPDDAGCTLPFEYWVQNQAKIPPQILVKVMDANQTEACVNYAEIEICANLGGASISPDILLRQQFLAAIMNYLTGADTGVIGNTINEAYDWLRSHLLVEIIPDEDIQLAQDYTKTLESYNRGEIGPGACEVEVLPVVQAETAIPSLTMSGPTAVIPPTSTIAPTPRRTVVITVPVPTDTPDQGPEPTQPPPPTNTVPVPSDTPPPPTNTQPPPPPPTDMPTPTPVPEVGTPTPVP